MGVQEEGVWEADVYLARAGRTGVRRLLQHSKDLGAHVLARLRCAVAHGCVHKIRQQEQLRARVMPQYPLPSCPPTHCVNLEVHLPGQVQPA
jgi:hypothetical protein